MPASPPSSAQGWLVGLLATLNTALPDLMVKVFYAAQKSGKFIPGEEPLLGTYMCRFSGADLSSNYHVPGAAHSAYVKEINTRQAFESHLLLRK